MSSPCISPYPLWHVLGVPVHELTEADVLAFARDRLASKQPAQIVTVNAEFVMKARADASFLEVLRTAHLATPDGAGVVWAMRRQGAHLRDRVGGSDLIWSLCGLAALHGYRVFLLGGQPGVAAQAGRVLCAHFPGLQLAGTHAGSPAIEDEPHIKGLIREARADILLVAFGAPAQDLWVNRNLASTGAVIAMGVGGSFDYVAGRAKRAPKWMQQHGLDWLWRLLRQPYRWRRMMALPHFAWLVVRERMRKEVARDST